MNIKKLLLLFVCSTSIYAEWDFPSVPIEGTGDLSDQNLNVGNDSDGNAISVWSSGTTQYSIWNGSSWTAPANIFLANNGENSRLAVNSPGNAIALERNALDNTVRAAFWNGSSWGSEATLSVINSTPTQVVMNSSGIGFALWVGDDGGTESLHSNRWDGDSWEGDQTIKSGITDIPDSNIAMDSSGNAVAVWKNDDTSRLEASVRKVGLGTWSPSEEISTVGVEFFPPQGLGMDDSGNAVVVWQDDSNFLQASYYNGATWTQTDPITSSLAPIGIVAMNADGQAITVYADGTAQLFSSTLEGLSWSEPIPINGTVGDGELSLGIDASGNAIITWSTSDNEAMAATWDGSSWSTPETLSPENDKLWGNIRIALNTTGDAVVAWGVDTNMGASNAENNGAHLMAPEDFIGTIFGGEFFQPAPPSNFLGTTGKNRFLTQTDHINFLTWDPSTSSDVVGYRVYEGGSVVAEVSATGPFEAEIHNRVKGLPNFYELVAFNASGQESDPVTLTVN